MKASLEKVKNPFLGECLMMKRDSGKWAKLGLEKEGV